MQLMLIGSFVFVVWSNWGWMGPYIVFSALRVQTYYVRSIGLVGVWHLLNPFRMEIYLVLKALGSIGLLIFAFKGLLLTSRHSKPLALVFLIWGGGLALIGVWGEFLPWVNSLQPGRYIFPVSLLLILLASPFLESINWKNRRVKGGTISALTLFFILQIFIFNKSLSAAMPRFTNTLPTYQTDLIEYLKAEGPFPGRLLLEADVNDPLYGGVLPRLTGQHVIGESENSNTVTRFSMFAGSPDPLLFGRRLREIKEAELASYLDLYHIQTVAVRSESSKKGLDGFSTLLNPFHEVNQFKIYKVHQKSSWFYEGEGQVSCEMDKLKISGVRPGRHILKFHWIQTLKSTPPLPLKPEFLKEDPFPFISVEVPDGVTEFEIINEGF